MALKEVRLAVFLPDTGRTKSWQEFVGVHRGKFQQLCVISTILYSYNCGVYHSSKRELC